MITNAVVRQTKGDKEMFIGHEFNTCSDFASLHFRRPFERVDQTSCESKRYFTEHLGLSNGLGCSKSGLGRYCLPGLS